jgi:hypothetical protein
MTIRKILALALLASTAFAMIAALGCTEKVHPPTAPGPGPGPTGPPLTPDSIQAIFSGYCTNCHTGGTSGSGGMDLTPDSSYSFLVNFPSTRCSPLDRVEPGDPVNSCIVQRIEGTVIPRMPMFQPALDDSNIRKIKNWISEGAGAVYASPSL